MRETVYLLLIWLGVTSVLAFVLFGWDKLLAKTHRRRIPEAALLGCALLGAAGHGGVPPQDPQALVSVFDPPGPVRPGCAFGLGCFVGAGALITLYG